MQGNSVDFRAPITELLHTLQRQNAEFEYIAKKMQPAAIFIIMSRTCWWEGWSRRRAFNPQEMVSTRCMISLPCLWQRDVGLEAVASGEDILQNCPSYSILSHKNIVNEGAFFLIGLTHTLVSHPVPPTFYSFNAAGLGAPVGSAVAGSADFISRAHRVRKALGGGMRQSGVVAAAALEGLRKQLPRLGDDHTNAKKLAQVCVLHGYYMGTKCGVRVYVLRDGWGRRNVGFVLSCCSHDTGDCGR